MPIEEKFSKFCLTDEMTEHFRSVFSVANTSNEENPVYLIETVLLGLGDADVHDKGAKNAELG